MFWQSVFWVMTDGLTTLGHKIGFFRWQRIYNIVSINKKCTENMKFIMHQVSIEFSNRCKKKKNFSVTEPMAVEHQTQPLTHDPEVQIWAGSKIE